MASALSSQSGVHGLFVIACTCILPVHVVHATRFQSRSVCHWDNEKSCTNLSPCYPFRQQEEYNAHQDQYRKDRVYTEEIKPLLE